MMKMITVNKDLYVVETLDGDIYLGTLKIKGTTITVYSGYVGRPPVIDVSDVADIVLASKHPAVVQ